MHASLDSGCHVDQGCNVGPGCGMDSGCEMGPGCGVGQSCGVGLGCDMIRDCHVDSSHDVGSLCSARSRDDARSGSSDGARGLERAMRYVTAAFDRRLVGRTFGGYGLERVLGQGRFGTGFLARRVGAGPTEECFAVDAPHGEYVLMKLVKPRGRGLRGVALDRDAVWAECAALSLCDHPGIPQWLGVVNERGRYFIVESLMSGRSLASWLAEGRVFSREEIAAIGLALIDIVEHASSRGVVHNDIRPANVLASIAAGVTGSPAASNAVAVEAASPRASFVRSHDGEPLHGAAETPSPRGPFVSGAASVHRMPGFDDSPCRRSFALDQACARMRVSLIDFGLAEFFDRSLSLCERMAASAPDVAGVAEVVISLLYSNRMNIRATAMRDTPWFEALILTPNQKRVLEDMFFCRVESFGETKARFFEAFK